MSRYCSLALAALISLPGGESLLLPAPAPHRAAAAAPLAARRVSMAYNPQPSKAKPRKAKSKEPKQKVKGPPSAAAQLQLVPEQTFYEAAPSITETIIPGLSVLTVVGIIPFGASLARQAWTRYKITNKRLEIKSGFQGKEVVQVTWREVVDVKWLRRFGGAAGDLVLTLQDGAKVEMRALAEFERNLNFIMAQLGDGVAADSGFPDGPAREFEERVQSGEEPPVELPPLSETEPAPNGA